MTNHEVLYMCWMMGVEMYLALLIRLLQLLLHGPHELGKLLHSGALLKEVHVELR
jgi:hypothetical protein